MSWLFSRVLVEAFSPQKSSATQPSAQLSVMPTQHPFWRKDKTMEPSRFSQFGLTCEALTADRGAELLTAWLEASRVRTSALPAQAQGLTESVRDYGPRWRASFARWSPELFGWKTAQCSLLEDSRESLATLPRWGSMRNGMLYLRQTLAPGIAVSGFGSLLPTLTVCGNYNARGASATSGDGLATALTLLPTLVADDTGMRKAKYAQGGTPLSLAVQSLMPTLMTEGLDGESNSRKAAEARGAPIPVGPLNPDWCEWFMGFPIGWTASEPLAMHKYREWQQQHSLRLQPR